MKVSEFLGVYHLKTGLVINNILDIKRFKPSRESYCREYLNAGTLR